MQAHNLVQHFGLSKFSIFLRPNVEGEKKCSLNFLKFNSKMCVCAFCFKNKLIFLLLLVVTDDSLLSRYKIVKLGALGPRLIVKIDIIGPCI